MEHRAAARRSERRGAASRASRGVRASTKQRRRRRLRAGRTRDARGVKRRKRSRPVFGVFGVRSHFAAAVGTHAVVQKLFRRGDDFPRRRLDASSDAPSDEETESSVHCRRPRSSVRSSVRSRSANISSRTSTSSASTSASTSSAASRSAMAGECGVAERTRGGGVANRARVRAERARGEKAAGASAPRNDSPNAPPSSSTPSSAGRRAPRACADGWNLRRVRRNARVDRARARRGRARRSTPRRRRRRRDGSRDARARVRRRSIRRRSNRRRCDRRRIGAAGGGGSRLANAPRATFPEDVSGSAARNPNRAGSMCFGRRARLTNEARRTSRRSVRSRRPTRFSRDAFSTSRVEGATHHATSLGPEFDPDFALRAVVATATRATSLGATAASAASISPSSTRWPLIFKRRLFELRPARRDRPVSARARRGTSPVRNHRSVPHAVAHSFRRDGRSAVRVGSFAYPTPPCRRRAAAVAGVASSFGGRARTVARRRRRVSANALGTRADSTIGPTTDAATCLERWRRFGTRQHSVTPYVTAMPSAQRRVAERVGRASARSAPRSHRSGGDHSPKQSVPSGVGTVPSPVGVVVTCVAADARRHAPRFAKTSARDAADAADRAAAPSRKIPTGSSVCGGAAGARPPRRRRAPRSSPRSNAPARRASRADTLSVDPCSRT